MARCDLCPHRCVLKEGQTGFCHQRINKEGSIVLKDYGAITSLSLDPIEKKPLYHFYPETQILSVGSYGCNNIMIKEWSFFFITIRTILF